jgi:hypothetical protein
MAEMIMVMVTILNRKGPVLQGRKQTVHDIVFIYYTIFCITKSITTSKYKIGEGGDPNSVFLDFRFSFI